MLISDGPSQKATRHIWQYAEQRVARGRRGIDHFTASGIDGAAE
jgi:hypothetical protein